MGEEEKNVQNRQIFADTPWRPSTCYIILYIIGTGEHQTCRIQFIIIFIYIFVEIIKYLAY